MKNKRNSYQKYKSPEAKSDTVIYRKMFIILDLKKKPLVHKDGHLLIFYRSRDAKSFVFNNKAQDLWRVKIVQLDITTL